MSFCDDCRSLTTMWLVAGGLTLFCMAMIGWQRRLVLLTVILWPAVTLQQWGFVNATSPRSEIIQYALGAVLSLLLPIVMWVVLEWRDPAGGLFALGRQRSKGTRTALSSLIGAVLCTGPAYVLWAIGWGSWTWLAFAVGASCGLLFGALLFRRSGSLTSA